MTALSARERNIALLLIDSYRLGIDTADAEVIELLRRRQDLSATVREMKTEVGMPLTDLKREDEITDRYRQGLGFHGPYLAHEILHHSKDKDA